ncbi:hypothetical protein K9M42_03175 [Patescibacteria group bacterium]|nr:hypothetical protein [Patescibacteria group bacterium]
MKKANFEYKPGDIVRCKKFLKCDYFNFYNGSDYKILRLYHTKNDEVTKVRIDIKTSSHTSKIFSKDDFYKYFYSKSEIRKIKIKKIEK